MPKPMLPLGGRPLIGHLVALLRGHGVAEIAVNLHHRPEAIRAYLGDGSKFGVRVTYSHEETLLGSAGAVKKLEPFFDESFFVLYGDVLTDIDLTALAAHHRSRGAILTMALHETDEPARCGIAEVDGDGMVRRFREKPAPQEVVLELGERRRLRRPSRRYCASYQRTHSSISAISSSLSCWSRGEPVGAYLSDGYFLDIGSLERYERAERDLAEAVARSRREDVRIRYRHRSDIGRPATVLRRQRRCCLYEHP